MARDTSVSRLEAVLRREDVVEGGRRVVVVGRVENCLAETTVSGTVGMGDVLLVLVDRRGLTVTEVRGRMTG